MGQSGILYHKGKSNSSSFAAVRRRGLAIEIGHAEGRGACDRVAEQQLQAGEMDAASLARELRSDQIRVQFAEEVAM